MTKKELVLLLVAFLLSFGSLVAYRIYKVQRFTKIVFQPQTSYAQLNPPLRAQLAQLLSQQGDVKYLARGASDFVTIPATVSALLEGESVATGLDGVVIFQVGQGAITTLGSQSEATVHTAMPTEVLLVLKQGSMTIDHLPTATAATEVRVLPALYKLSSGSTQLQVTAQTITIAQLSGEGQIGMIDATNTTQVIELIAGKTAEIDRPQKTVKLR